MRGAPDVQHTLLLPLSQMVEDTLNYLKDLGDNGPLPDAQGKAAQEDLSRMAQFSIDEYRPMKVIVIGAGFTGVAAAIRCVNAFLTVMYTLEPHSCLMILILAFGNTSLTSTLRCTRRATALVEPGITTATRK